MNSILRQVTNRLVGIVNAPVPVRGSGYVEDVLAEGRPALCELPLDRGIGLHHFPLGGRSIHPFAHAVRGAIARVGLGGQGFEAELRSGLSAYYTRVRPASAAEWLGLDAANDDSPLHHLPPAAAIFPWQMGSPEGWLKSRATGVQRENQLAGCDIEIGHGWHACGPVTESKLMVEARRLDALVRSIGAHGLKRHGGRDGDMDAVLLRDGNTERWWLNYGHHRAAVLSALGYESVPVRVTRVVSVGDVERLLQVRSGLFTPTQAEGLIRRMIHGELPPVLQAWERVQAAAHAEA